MGRLASVRRESAADTCSDKSNSNIDSQVFICINGSKQKAAAHTAAAFNY
jgi:hypothetical protein